MFVFALFLPVNSFSLRRKAHVLLIQGLIFILLTLHLGVVAIAVAAHIPKLKAARGLIAGPIIIPAHQKNGSM
jgi:hypothetical protein